MEPIANDIQWCTKATNHPCCDNWQQQASFNSELVIKMADFDADRIYYSHQNLQQQQQPGGGDGAASNPNNANGRMEDEEERAVDSDALRRHYREFLSK